MIWDSHVDYVKLWDSKRDASGSAIQAVALALNPHAVRSGDILNRLPH